MIQLRSTTSSAVINTLKSTFARHGIPEILKSDNGLQFTAGEFDEFTKSYNFLHTTSSPHYPESNGQAERTVKSVKRLLKRAEDPFLALLSYRSTPLPWCGRSPAELLMGRKIQSNLPHTSGSLVPQWSYLKDFRQANACLKKREKGDHDCRHRTRELPAIPENTDVWITTEGQPVQGKVMSTCDAPRSYVVRTPTGDVRRNRIQLNVQPPPVSTTVSKRTTDAPTTSTNTPTDRSPIMTRRRTGTSINPPKRLT